MTDSPSSGTGPDSQAYIQKKASSQTVQVELGHDAETKLQNEKRQIVVDAPRNVLEFVRNTLTVALQATRQDPAAPLSQADKDWVETVAQRLDDDERSRDLFLSGMDFNDEPEALPSASGSASDKPRDFSADIASVVEAAFPAPSPSDTSATTPEPRPPAQQASASPAPTAPAAAPEAPAAQEFPALIALMQEVLDEHGHAGLEQLRQAIEHEAPSDQRIPMLQAFERLRHVLKPRRRNASQQAAPDERKAIRGGFSEIALEGSITLRDRPGDANFSLRYTLSRLAPTIERLEQRSSDIRTEQLVDLIVHWFAGESVYAGGQPPEATPEFREVLNRLRAMLMQAASLEAGPDGQPAPSLGLLETVTNVITWFGMAKGDSDQEAACRLCASAFSLESIQLFLRARGDSARMGRMLSQLANNAAGWISDELGLRQDEDRAEARKAAQLNTLHALGTVAHLRQVHSGRWNEDAKNLFHALGAAPAEASADDAAVPQLPAAERWTFAARAMLFMSNIPSAWRDPGEILARERSHMPHPFEAENANARFRTAVLAALSAVVRAQFNAPQDADEVPSALFNLGVDVMSMKRATAGLRGGAMLRILTNGMGLIWALSKAKDNASFLNALHGGDCAVNFFGAMADREVRDFSTEKGTDVLLRPMLEAVLAEARRLGLTLMRARVEGSFRTLFGADEPPRDALMDRAVMSSRCIALLVMVLQRWRGEHGEVADLCESEEALTRALDGPNFAITCARCLRWGFDGLVTEQGKRGASAAFSATSTWWTTVAWRLSELSLADDYGAFADRIPSRLSDWGIEDEAEAYQGPVSANLLSTTLSDEQLMARFFGADRTAA